MKKTVVVVVLIGLLGALGFKVAVRAYRVTRCNRFAQIVAGMAKERDSGVSSDVLRARLKATESAQSKPDPEIHDLMENTITGIYEHPELSPQQLGDIARDGCLTHR
jgi:hypothetical protein